MEAVNDALKLISQCLELLEKTDWVDGRDNHPDIVEQVEDMLRVSIDKLAQRST